jgi:hypothetical protein
LLSFFLYRAWLFSGEKMLGLVACSGPIRAVMP